MNNQKTRDTVRNMFTEYLEKNGLNERMVKKGKEIELLQFMYSKRDEFLALDVNKD